MSPICPFGPRLPFSPLTPCDPVAPGFPAGPGGPVFPGAPTSPLNIDNYKEMFTIKNLKNYGIQMILQIIFYNNLLYNNIIDL